MDFLRFDNSINFKLNIYTRINSIAFAKLCEIFGDKSEPTKEIKLLFSGKYYFDTYISNTGSDTGEISIVVATDTKSKVNSAFLNLLKGYTISMFAIMTNEGIFITNVARVAAAVGQVSNRCIKCEACFDTTGKTGGEPLPEDIKENVYMLAPIGKSDIAGNVSVWDEYLKITENYARHDECSIKYSKIITDKNSFSKIFYVEENKINPRHINSSVMLVDHAYEENGDTVYCGDVFGTIAGFDEKSITVLIDDEFRTDYEFPASGVLHITKYGDIVQIKRLRGGLKRFEGGRALNPYMDVFMFDSSKARIPRSMVDLDDEKLLAKNMNEEQRRAVAGALSAEDLFLIQGPPGTGKTTAIAEICYQNALRGKKTLIASQTNLAVDNALSRLAADPKIRALRRGNEKTVQKEGMAFTEDNVISTWIKNTAESCKNNLGKYENMISQILELEQSLDKISEIHENYVKQSRFKNDLSAKLRLTEKLLSFGETDYTELETSVEAFKNTYDSAVIKRAVMAELGDFKCPGDLKDKLEAKWEILREALKKAESAITGVELCETALKTVSKSRASLDDAFEITMPKYPEFEIVPRVMTKPEIMMAYGVLSGEADALLKCIPGGFFRMFNLYGRWNKKAVKVYEKLIRTEADLKCTLPVFKKEEEAVFKLNSIDEKIDEVYAILKEICGLYKDYIKSLQARKKEAETELDKLSRMNEDAFYGVLEFDKQVPQRFKRAGADEIAHMEDIKSYYTSLWKDEKESLYKIRDLEEKWINRINSKNPEDYEALKNIYINNANVIGITCNGSGSSDFIRNYPEFDMVIIDEVSKATPPEIILPALKAKTIVLVGDHKQLPPMIGNDTYEEAAKEIGAEEISKMKISLFESLYMYAPADLKVMLKTQYRMHSQIMNTINQFYEEEGGLVCGLDDKLHEHDMEGGFIKKDTHAMWVYTPYENSFKEKRDDTSFYNEYEILCIEKILQQMNENLEIKGAKSKKEVGVITFYGAQTLRLADRISGEKYPMLDIRIGTVDKFQGIEKSVIICSFVRNNPMGDIGFAKDKRRINVALSRAQELLVIVGCKDMFIQADEKYKQVFEKIVEAGGDVDALDIV